MRMKRLSLLLIVVLGGTAWAQQAGSTPNHTTSPTSGKATGITISPEEWQELRAARSTAMQTNPDLIAEDKKLSERMSALEDKLDAVMVKANPSIAPIIAKFEAGRRRPAMAANSRPTDRASQTGPEGV